MFVCGLQKPILHDLSLTVNPGETLALVGASGGGKSSVVKLIAGFYVPEKGSIKLDGYELQAFDRRWLMRHMAFVGQEPVLYARSITRNILFGLEGADGYHDTPSEMEVWPMELVPSKHLGKYLMIGGEHVPRWLPEPPTFDCRCLMRHTAFVGREPVLYTYSRSVTRNILIGLEEAYGYHDTPGETGVCCPCNSFAWKKAFRIKFHCSEQCR